MVYAIVGVLVCALILGSTAISGGIMLGLLAIAGLAVIFSQLPSWIKRFIISMRLLFDFGISAMVYLLIGSDTVTGLVGAATAGLLATLLLHHQAKKESGKSVMADDARHLLRNIGS